MFFVTFYEGPGILAHLSWLKSLHLPLACRESDSFQTDGWRSPEEDTGSSLSIPMMTFQTSSADLRMAKLHEVEGLHVTNTYPLWPVTCNYANRYYCIKGLTRKEGPCMLSAHAGFSQHPHLVLVADEIRQKSQQSAAEERSSKTGLRRWRELSLGGQARGSLREMHALFPSPFTKRSQENLSRW